MSSKSLAEALPEQQARVRRLIGIYREIGPAGIFAITLMEQALQRADNAASSGDVVEMIRSYRELEEFKE